MPVVLQALATLEMQTVLVELVELAVLAALAVCTRRTPRATRSICSAGGTYGAGSSWAVPKAPAFQVSGAADALQTLRCLSCKKPQFEKCACREEQFEPNTSSTVSSATATASEPLHAERSRAPARKRTRDIPRIDRLEEPEAQ